MKVLITISFERDESGYFIVRGGVILVVPSLRQAFFHRTFSC